MVHAHKAGGIPMSTHSLDSAIEQSHGALARIVNGDPGGYLALYSESEDVTLGNPFGPFAHGRQNVAEQLSRAASNYRHGEVTSVELIAKHLSEDLACVVEVESVRAKVGGGEETLPVSLRVTSVFRLERDEWKLLHRHADPITAPRAAASVVSE